MCVFMCVFVCVCVFVYVNKSHEINMKCFI